MIAIIQKLFSFSALSSASLEPHLVAIEIPERSDSSTSHFITPATSFVRSGRANSGFCDNAQMAAAATAPAGRQFAVPESHKLFLARSDDYFCSLIAPRPQRCHSRLGFHFCFGSRNPFNAMRDRITATAPYHRQAQQLGNLRIVEFVHISRSIKISRSAASSFPAPVFTIHLFRRPS